MSRWLAAGTPAQKRAFVLQISWNYVITSHLLYFKDLNEIYHSALPLDGPGQQTGLGEALQHLVELVLQGGLVVPALLQLVGHVVPAMLQLVGLVVRVLREDEADRHLGKTGHQSRVWGNETHLKFSV